MKSIDRFIYNKNQCYIGGNMVNYERYVEIPTGLVLSQMLLEDVDHFYRYSTMPYTEPNHSNYDLFLQLLCKQSTIAWRKKFHGTNRSK
jgi:hypothetical protein